MDNQDVIKVRKDVNNMDNQDVIKVKKGTL